MWFHLSWTGVCSASRRGLFCAALSVVGAVGCAEPAAPETAHAPPVVEVSGVEETPVPEPAPPRATTLWIGGDVLLSDALRDHARRLEDPAQGFATVLDGFRRHWEEDEGAFVVVNLETPTPQRRRHGLRDSLGRSSGPSRVHLHAPTWLVHGLARAGVDAVTLANNHALDQEDEGLAETIDEAHAAGLAVLGAGKTPHRRWPLVAGDTGAEIALLNYFDGYFLIPGREPERGVSESRDVPAATVSPLDETAIEEVRQSAAQVPTVVVVHVLGELQRRPKSRWRWWAQRLVDAGAKAIVVHGTHVLLPVEELDGVPVVWGLGNLVSDMGRQANPRRRDRGQLPKVQSAEVHETLMVRIRREPGGELELRFVAGWMHDDRFVRWHTGQGGDIAFSLLPFSSCERAVALPEAPGRLGEQLDAWMRRRFAHVQQATRLVPGACESGSLTWWRMAP